VEHNGSGKPAVVATNYQSGDGMGNGKNGGGNSEWHGFSLK
jgi:hypothetical protein